MERHLSTSWTLVHQRKCVVHFSVYLIDRILPLGKRTWGWPTPAEPLPDASNTNWEEKKPLGNQITILNSALNGCLHKYWGHKLNVEQNTEAVPLNPKTQIAVNTWSFTLDGFELRWRWVTLCRVTLPVWIVTRMLSLRWVGVKHIFIIIIFILFILTALALLWVIFYSTLWWRQQRLKNTQTQQQ